MKTSEVPLNQKIALSLDEAAALSCLSKSTIYHLMRDGLLPFSKVAKRRLVLRKDLEDFLSSCRQFESCQTGLR
jgi:excisionase family DNA binding protein